MPVDINAAGATGAGSVAAQRVIQARAAGTISDVVGRYSDIATLQAWTGSRVGRRYPNGYILGDVPLDRHPMNANGYEPFDYTPQAQELLRPSLLLNRFPYTYETSGIVETVEKRVLIPQAQLSDPDVLGVGCYLDGQEIVMDKSELLSALTGVPVQLASGQTARVFRFVSKGMEFGLGGNGGSLYEREYDFKFFVVRRGVNEAGNEVIYRVWEDVDQNHAMRPGQGVTQLNREAELLRS